MPLKIIGGSSNKDFTDKICKNLGIEEAKTTIQSFSNENQFFTIHEPVRGDDVFVIQTQTSPVDKHIIELLIIIRTLRDASANRITAVLPYLPYSRSDKKDQPRICIGARLMADLLESAGANRVLIVEMHSPQIQGFFSVPCDQLIASPDIVKHLKQNWDLTNFVAVAGDAGAAKMIRDYADGLNLPVAIMDKRREGNEEKVKIKGVIGEVKNKKILIIDDETSSGRTLIEDAEYLLNEAGVEEVNACFVHPAFNESGCERLNNSRIKKFITTDTIPLRENLRDLEVISLTQRCAEMIRRIHDNESVKSLNEII